MADSEKTDAEFAAESVGLLLLLGMCFVGLDGMLNKGEHVGFIIAVCGGVPVMTATVVGGSVYLYQVLEKRRRRMEDKNRRLLINTIQAGAFFAVLFLGTRLFLAAGQDMTVINFEQATALWNGITKFPLIFVAIGVAVIFGDWVESFKPKAKNSDVGTGNKE